MIEFVTELVEIVHFLAYSPISLFKSCRAKVFSLQIICAAAVLILFCDSRENVLQVRCCLACFWCRSDVWRRTLKFVSLYAQYMRSCAWNIVQGKWFPFACSFQYLLFFQSLHFHKVLRWNEIVNLQYRFWKGNEKAIYFCRRWQWFSVWKFLTVWDH